MPRDLLAHGFGDTVRSILVFLRALGGQVIEHAVNRVDYAMDIRADEFVLELDVPRQRVDRRGVPTPIGLASY